VTWLGLLFSMLSLAESSYVATGEACDFTGQYRLPTIQALISADYTNPKTYTIETMMMYIQMEWATSQDTSMEISLVIGLIVRLAMRMGIHRDPKSYPVTPFQGQFGKEYDLCQCIKTYQILSISTCVLVNHANSIDTKV